MKKINPLDLPRFGNLEFLAKQVVEGFITGLHKSPFHGFSVEFAEHRLYNKGESTKHIDWKLYGKTDKLFSKKYDEETNLRCQLVIDCSSSMLYGSQKDTNKLDYAVCAAAALIELLKKQRDAVGLTFYTDVIELHTQAKSSSSHHHYLLEELAKKRQDYTSSMQDQTNTIACIHQIAEICHKRSLIVLFTDLIDSSSQREFIEALEHLKHNKHEVIVFYTFEKSSELNFEIGNRPVRIIDMETKEELKLQPNEVKHFYQEKASTFFKEITIKCGQLNIDFVELNIEEPLELVLQKYLVKRQKMN
jgi:uncharacterized protein (DUF58 family)